MKPRFLCSECESELRWGEQFCSRCGKPVEWPTAEDRPAAREGSRKQSRKEERQGTGGGISWKVMTGFAAFIVGGVILLESLTGTRNVPASVQAPVPAQPQGANMQAMEHLQELEAKVKANPDDLDARLHLANFAHDNRFYDKAIDQYRQYLERNPSNADALVDLGICYNDIGDFGEAVKTMERALTIDPKHLLGHFNLGIVNLRAGNLEEANKWFQKTVALAPESEVAKRAQQLLHQHTTLPSN